MTLTRWSPRTDVWDPFANLADIREEMNRLFDTSLRRFGAGTPFEGGYLPPCDLIEEKDSLLLRMDLPGLRKEDVSVTLQDNVLTIKGERKPEPESKETTVYLRERVHGAFTRTIELPTPVEAGRIDAHFREGVLHVMLPKSEAAKPKQIEVKVG